jgi:hypothetical protein
VLGSRLVATAFPNVYGARPCSDAPPEQPSTVLYASDDGGQIWQPIGQSIENQQLAIGGMTLMGTTVVALAYTLSPGGCAPNFHPATSLWGSSDGGQSWQQIASLAPRLAMLSFTPRADATGYDGVALGVDPPAPVPVLFSADGGATWSPLPGLDPARTTITDPANEHWTSLAVTPTGAVVAQVFPSTTGGPSGIFTIRPSDPQPAWTLYAPVAGPITVVDGTTF